MRIPKLLGLACCSLAAASDVLTQHNDIARTGAILDERILSPASIRKEGFGRLFSLAVDGQIYAQPLVVSGIAIASKGTRNAVYVATMRNRVYAFDADGGDALPLWETDLGPSMRFDRIPKDAGALIGQYNIRPYIGITSTPVIDRAAGRMYVVAKIAVAECPGTDEAKPECPVIYRIHALDLSTGKVLRQTDIEIPMQEQGVPAADVARRHLQRPALLLANHKVYAGFGAHQDAPPYHGWLISFDADTLRQLDVFCTTPKGEMGGIWQAGNGPAADEQGNIYIMTSNGTFDPTKNQYGCTFLKMSPDLKPVSWFAPANVDALNSLDIDLGSSGPMLLPGTGEILGGGKQGKLYLVNQGALGGKEQHHWLRDQLNPPVQFFQASRRWRITWLSWFPLLFNAGYHHIHGAPVYWNSAVNGPSTYLWPEEDRVKAYRYEGAKFNIKPKRGMMGNMGMPGGFLSISANGRDKGVLWGAIPLQEDAYVEIVRGTLRAFDADTLELLWSTDSMDPNDYFDFAKYVPPTIANGKVYLATFSDRLNVYGLHSPLAVPGQKPMVHVSSNARHRGHMKGASGHTLHTAP